MTDKMIVKFLEAANKDLRSYKEALDRFEANQQTQQATLAGFAEAWMQNLRQIEAALSSQAEMLRALQAVVLRNEPIN